MARTGLRACVIVQAACRPCDRLRALNRRFPQTCDRREPGKSSGSHLWNMICKYVYIDIYIYIYTWCLWHKHVDLAWKGKLSSYNIVNICICLYIYMARVVLGAPTGSQAKAAPFRCLPIGSAKRSEDLQPRDAYGSGSKIRAQNRNPGKWKHALNLWSHGGLIWTHTHV